MEEFIIKYWLEALFAGILAIGGCAMGRINTRLRKEASDQECVKLGVMALLRDQIIKSYNLHMRMGYFDLNDRDNITHLYEQYRNLGGNSNIGSLVKEAKELPVRKEDVIK